jgi:hypothetical protein
MSLPASNGEGPAFPTASLRAAALAHPSMSGGNSPQPAPAAPAAPANTPPPPTPASSPAPPAPPVAPSAQPPAAPEQATPQVQALPSEPSAQDILDLPDDKFVKLIVDGQPVVKRVGDLKKEGMLHSKFTKEMQTLRQKEALLESTFGPVEPQRIQAVRHRLQQAAQLEQILTNPQLLARYISEAMPQVAAQFVPAPVAPSRPAFAGAPAQPQAAGYDPEEIASVGQVESLLSSRMQNTLQDVEAKAQQIMQSVTATVEQKIQAFQDAKEADRIRGSIHSTVDAIVAENPILKIIPNLHDNVKFEVGQMLPRTEAEVLEATKIVLRGIVEQATPFLQQRAVDAAQRAQTLTQGIEPPSGTVPGQSPTSFRDSKTGQFGWDRVRAAAKAYSR